MVSKKSVNTLLASAVALTAVGGISAGANAMGADKEKCYGVVKAAHNDCGASDKSHSCAGHATADGAGTEWLGLPKGVCERLVGGSLAPVAAADAAVDAAKGKVMEKATDAAKGMMDKH